MSRKGTLASMPVSQEGVATAAIDISRLDLATNGDRELAREVLGLFLQQAEQVLTLIDAGPPAEEAHIAVHALRGAALALGLPIVAATADPLEAEYGALIAGQNRVSEAGIVQLTADFRIAVEQACAEIRALAFR